MNGHGTNVVVGIDLGTTYSAAAWAIASDPEHVDVIRNWPSSGQLVGNKVPTEVAYAIEGSGDPPISWGYDISPRSRRVKWFKLGLETDDEDILSLPFGLSALDVTRDFLTELRRHIQSTLARRLGSKELEEANFHFVLTVPAIWSDAAKKNTETAAMQAGFKDSQSSLELLSEPESAAIFSLKTIENVLRRVKPQDRIVVCDAGGGTVDLISYELMQTEPTLSVSECTAGTGDFCGSSFVDREFEKLLSQRLGPAYEALTLVQRQQILKNFETSKIAFRGSESRSSFYVSVPSLTDAPATGLVGGNLEISRDEMQALFDPVVADVLELIEQQVTATAQRVNAVLLVGGFGESEYLYQRVHEWAAPLGIEVLQPRDAATAVVQGAVMRGLERLGPLDSHNKVQVVRRARRSYGVPAKEVFDAARHREEDAARDTESGQMIARHQVRWFLHANAQVADDDVFRHRFRRTFTHLTPWEDSVVSSPRVDPPPRLEASVRRHCTIRSDLSHLDPKKHFSRERKGLKRFYVAEYELVISLRGSNFTVWLEYRGERYGVSEVQFESTSERASASNSNKLLHE